MSRFLDAIQSFLDDIRREKGWVDELNAHSRTISSLYETMTNGEPDEALRRLAAILPELPMVAFGHVAITCGALTERGGDPAIAGPGLFDKLPRRRGKDDRFLRAMPCPRGRRRWVRRRTSQGCGH